MASEPQLESYLQALDKALGPVSVSERAEIITEIKSHVMEARSRDPNASLNGILSSLGEPQTVANRYLLERGLKPGKPPRAPVIKWLIVGFLGTFGIICATLLLLVWRFTPLISVDEKSDHVVLLGGAIDVHGDNGHVKIGAKTIIDGDESRKIEGSAEIDPKKVIEVQIPFHDGKLTLKTSKDNRVHWDCQISKDAPEKNTHRSANAFQFDFGDTAAIKCEIAVPRKLKSIIDGSDGKVSLDKLMGDLDLHMVNGKISFLPEPSAHYKYDIKVRRGMTDEFKSSDDPEAFSIKVELENGKVSND